MPSNVPPNVSSPEGRAMIERFNPPIDADPRAIKGDTIESRGNEGLLNDARAAATAMYRVWGTTADLRDRVQDKPLLAKKVQVAVERSLREAEPRINRLRERRESEQAKIKAMFDAGDRDQLGKEVRDIARNRDGDSFVFVTERINAGDQRSVAAILAAPAYMSGLTPKQHDDIRTIAERTFAPEGVGLVEDLGRTIQRLEQTTQAMGETIAPMIQEWQGGDAALLQQLDNEGSSTDGIAK